MESSCLEKLEIACNADAGIFSRLVFAFREKKFRSEKAVQKFILNEIRKEGCFPAFPPIVASGKNGADPHAKPASKLFNGFCVIDFGCAFKGIKSDMTRTIYLGNPSLLEKRLYYKVLEAQKKMILFVKPGMKGKKAALKLRDFLGELAFACPHGLGHGVSTKIHDKPSLKTISNDTIKLNDALTIEPGIYFPKFFGIRIEDTILIGKKKNTPLTKAPKKLVVLRNY